DLPTIRTAGRFLFLTGGTIERAPIADRHPLDRARTNSAGFAGAVINAQMILKLARFVVGVAVIRKRRAAPADGVAKQLRNQPRQYCHLAPRQTMRARGRLDAGERENLIRIDIAEAGDDLLVEKQIADAPLGCAGKTKKILGVQRRIE